MLLHTIANEYEIFGVSMPNYKVRTAPIKGGFVEIVNSSGNEHVRRLISTNPSMYLNKSYQPCAGFDNLTKLN